MFKLLKLVAAVVTAFLGACDAGELHIGSFNVEVFGISKMAMPYVPDILVKIFLNYDVLFMMEIRDISNTAVYDLLSRINAKSSAPYAVTVSERLGRTNSKEQYAYFYRTDKVQLRDVQTYADTKDLFERPPYIAHFKQVNDPDPIEFTAVGCHVKPSKAQEEIDSLYDMYYELELWRPRVNTLIMGDFNADCEYLSGIKFRNLKMRNDPRFTWLFDQSGNTTPSPSNCAYDHMILASSGKDLNRYIASGPGVVFDFRAAYGLSQEVTMTVSDHFPIGAAWARASNTALAAEEAHGAGYPVLPLAAAMLFIVSVLAIWASRRRTAPASVLPVSDSKQPLYVKPLF